MKLCSVPGCSGRHLALGLCQAHYLRQYKHGRLHLVVLRGFSAVDRILSKVIKTADGCWLYSGRLTKKGYAHVHGSYGKMRFAHVIMFEDKHGQVPAGLELDHLCRRRNCCNPDHVEPVTHAENMRRGIAGHDWKTRKRDSDGRFAKEGGA